MDIQLLLSETKARFSHNSAKDYLREKYSSKFLVADQGGLWKADIQTLSFLSAFDTDELVVIDTQNNPVLVNRNSLLEKIKTVYTNVTNEYYKEWKELETKR